MEEHEAKGSTLYLVGITIVATIGGFLFGFDSGAINGTVEGLQTAFQSNSAGTGFSVASILLGCAVGAYFAGRLADHYGRRSIMIVSSVLFIISAFATGAAHSVLEFVIARLVTGLAIGAVSVLGPIYISEIAPANKRGMLTSLQQTAIIVGLFMAFISNFLIAKSAGSATNSFWLGAEAWRWMFWMELIPSAIFLIGLLFIPETPRFYVLKGKNNKARDVLIKVLGPIDIDKKVAEIAASMGSRPRISDLWDSVKKRVKPIVWVGIGLGALQQLVGINVIFYYGAVLWRAVGFTESDALLINIISAGVSIIAVGITLLIVDKVGRKPIMWIGSAGMTVTLVILAYAFSTATTGADGGLSLSSSMGIVALIAANVYVFFFNGTWGPVMWVLLGEMFPNQLRGSGLAVSGTSQWLGNFAVTMTFPILLATIGLTGAYSIYAAFALVSLVFVLLLIPETKGKELEEMDALWKNR